MDTANGFEDLLASTVRARELKEQEEQQEAKSLDGHYLGSQTKSLLNYKRIRIYERVSSRNANKRRKVKGLSSKSSEDTVVDFELELEHSEIMNKLVTEFAKVAPTLEKMVKARQHFTSGNLISDYQLSSSPSLVHTLQPQITIPEIFEYLTHWLKNDMQHLWVGITSFVLIMLRQYPTAIVETSPTTAMTFIKKLMEQINVLPVKLSKGQMRCVEKGQEVIEAFLTGKGCGGVGCVSYYHIIQEFPAIFGAPVNGHFENVHWTMEPFVHELCKRRRRLSFIMMPPDASWPLVSQYSRDHEYNDLAGIDSNRVFAPDYDQFVQEGCAASFTSRFRDLFFQRAWIEEVRIMAKKVKGTQYGLEPVRAAIFEKVKDIIIYIQENSKFNERRQDAFGEPRNQRTVTEQVLIPNNLDHWELMIEVADQLYSLVGTEHYVKYEEALTEFCQMVRSGDDDSCPQLLKDNGFIWLLLQLSHIERVMKETISVDLSKDEKLFRMLSSLYNEKQITSKDAFYLRDLSLQCFMAYHQNSLNTTNLKYRHPELFLALPYSKVCADLSKYVFTKYKGNTINVDLFRNIQFEEIIKLAIVSEANESLVADTLLANLISPKLELGTLAFPSAKYLKGGSATYKLLDYIGVHAKNRLSFLIGKMSFDEKGPTSFSDSPQKEHNSVSPYVLDALFKMLYSAPWSLSQIIIIIFERLKKYDKALKVKAEDGPALPEQSLRWTHTILELFNYRLLRFFKQFTKTPDLLNFVKYSLSHLNHRQTFRGVEMFAIHSMMLQVDVKFIRSIGEAIREKSILFTESEMLARILIMTIARIVKFRGTSDLQADLLSKVLTNIYPSSLEWSPAVFNLFPEPVKQILESQQAGNAFPPDNSAVLAAIHAAIQEETLLNLVKDEILNEKQEAALKERYSDPESQKIFLCAIWTVLMHYKKQNPLRSTLLQFAPSRMATYTAGLIDHIVSVSTPQWKVLECALLAELIWKYQILAFEHVIYALICHQREETKREIATGFLNCLLFEPEGFSQRVARFMELGFCPRYWVEDDFHGKLMQYLEDYPEFYEYEAFAMDGYANTNTPLNPPPDIQMPIYYSNVIFRTLPIFDILIGNMIAFGNTELLRFLDEYGKLYRYHQTPLTFVRDLFCYYYPTSTIRDPNVCRRLVKLLDFDDYNIAPELLEYVNNESVGAEIFDENYFDKVFRKLADNMLPQKCAPKTKSHFPERHFREISNPMVLALYIACVEVLATPVEPVDVVRMALNIILVRGTKNVAVPPIIIHAVALLLSFLPQDEFVIPMLTEIVNVVKTDAHLREPSAVCTLPSNTQSDKSASFFAMDPPNPFLEPPSPQAVKTIMFPYIFKDYTSNYHNFGTNAPNTLLTLAHSIIHYSNNDIVERFFGSMLIFRDEIKTDVQVLYLCALMGPVLHRLEKNVVIMKEYIIHLMQLLHDVTSTMRLEENVSTLALEQIYDFL
ncbi:7213_t:CDS:10 [Paraglomus occultum]|uniref:7213_t:CDS:1 n=1 Tax=Paraglomus occultum TaxID=144539 RepID=A0A9N9B7A6_9GLOM|nr:7213_t:CDS:10 [Paraglomus occultum]